MSSGWGAATRGLSACCYAYARSRELRRARGRRKNPSPPCRPSCFLWFSRKKNSNLRDWTKAIDYNSWSVCTICKVYLMKIVCVCVFHLLPVKNLTKIPCCKNSPNPFPHVLRLCTPFFNGALVNPQNKPNGIFTNRSQRNSTTSIVQNPFIHKG